LVVVQPPFLDMKNGEDICSFTEYMKRYTVDPTISVTGTAIPAQGNQPVASYTNEVVTGESSYNNMSLILRNFYFQRGSKRSKIIWQPSINAALNPRLSVQTYAYNSHLSQDNYYQTGGFYQALANNPQMDIQVPFFYPYPFYAWNSFTSETAPSPGYNITNYEAVITNVKVFRSVGDDFTMAWPTGIGRMIYTPPSEL